MHEKMPKLPKIKVI